MKYTSAILRILCGVILIFVSFRLYSSSQETLSGGNQHGVEIFGFITSLTPAQTPVFYIAAGIAGLLFVAFGLFSFLRQR